MAIGIILAAGSGIRFGTDIPKQFVKINNRRILDFSVHTFDSNPLIDEVIIVVNRNWGNIISKEYSNFKIVSGGETRKDSSFAGLITCNSGTNKVLIHDSARPFVDHSIIEDCIKALDNNSAVTTAIPVNDTIIQIQDDNIIEMPNRSILRAEQTPQGFDYQTIMKAHKQFRGDATDDIRLVMELGITPKFITGSPKNFKITTLEDLNRAKLILGKKN